LVRAVTAISEGTYANDAIYSNLGGDPLYSNVAEVRNIPLEKKILFKERILLLRRFCYLQASEAQALLEVPGRSGLAGSTAEAVARGLGRAQSSSRQPLPGLRPLGLRMEVGHLLSACSNH
jgi:hypothetical protein